MKPTAPTVIATAILTLGIGVLSANPADPDLSFHAPYGFVYLGLSDNDEWPTDIVTSSDGTAYVAAIVETSNGSTGFRPAVMKIAPTGEPDYAFGSAGIYEIPVDLPDWVRGSFVDIGLMSDGGIVVSMPGDGGSPVSKNFFVYKVNPTGTGPDVNFGILGLTGVAFDFISGGHDWPYDLVVQPDDGIVVVGYGEATSQASSDLDFAVARFTADGGVDSTFGVNGKVRAYWDSGGQNMDMAFGVALTSTGEIVVVGQAQTASGWDLAVLVLDSSGSRLTSFDTDGMATYRYTPLGGPASTVTMGRSVATILSIIEAPDTTAQTIVDAIYIAGAAYDPTNLVATSDISVLCLSGDGSTCGSFGVQGWSLIDLSDNGLGGIGDTDDIGLHIVPDSLKTSLTVVAEAAQTGGASLSHAAVVCLDSFTGLPDPTFGVNGKRYYTVPASYGMSITGTLDPQDRILYATEEYLVNDYDVRLNRLIGGRGIFSDGFESGGVSAWSTSSP